MFSGYIPRSPRAVTGEPAAGVRPGTQPEATLPPLTKVALYPEGMPVMRWIRGLPARPARAPASPARGTP
ncbi:hypothetical protein GCM10009544_57630 [Streptomyces stramineus]|uniref:Uncharacterized protein n=1 Tax=Streptomyces stramineus TaxID=173861 RepID=A0ABN1B2J6_9ACTN